MTDHVCPNCGTTVVCDAKRHNKAGEGFHGAKEVTRLGPVQLKIVDLVLNGRYDWDNGLPSWDVYTALKKFYRANEPMPVVNTIRGYLSIMAGKGLEIVRVEKNAVDLVDRPEMKFRFKKEERWFLNASPTLPALSMLEDARRRERERQMFSTPRAS
jgi:hypothetical protein